MTHPTTALILPYHDLWLGYEGPKVSSKLLEKMRMKFLHPLLEAKSEEECERALSDGRRLYAVASRWTTATLPSEWIWGDAEKDFYRWLDQWVSPPFSWLEGSEEETNFCYLCFTAFRESAALVRATRMGQRFSGLLDAWECGAAAVRLERIMNAAMLVELKQQKPVSDDAFRWLLREGVKAADELVLAIADSRVTWGVADDRYSSSMKASR